MKMTKKLYDKCRNPLKQAFCDLDAETQTALAYAAPESLLERLTQSDNANYYWEPSGWLQAPVPVNVYRISDKAAPPPEPEFEEVPVRQSKCAPRRWYIERNRDQFLLTQMPDFCDFVGITYDVGFVKLNPYNPAVGTPVSVRLKKETK